MTKEVKLILQTIDNLQDDIQKESDIKKDLFEKSTDRQMRFDYFNEWMCCENKYGLLEYLRYLIQNGYKYENGRVVK